jgi:hypothetical protein
MDRLASSAGPITTARRGASHRRSGGIGRPRRFARGVRRSAKRSAAHLRRPRSSRSPARRGRPTRGATMSAGPRRRRSPWSSTGTTSARIVVGPRDPSGRCFGPSARSSATSSATCRWARCIPRRVGSRGGRSRGRRPVLGDAGPAVRQPARARAGRPARPRGPAGLDVERFWAEARSRVYARRVPPLRARRRLPARQQSGRGLR